MVGLSDSQGINDVTVDQVVTTGCPSFLYVYIQPPKSFRSFNEGGTLSALMRNCTWVRAIALKLHHLI